MYQAPLWASEMVLLLWIFALSIDTAGELGSWGYLSQSPPAVIRTWRISSFCGQMSHTMFAYDTLQSAGMVCFLTKKSVPEPSMHSFWGLFRQTPCSRRRPHSFSRLRSQVRPLGPFNNFLIDPWFPFVVSIGLTIVLI